MSGGENFCRRPVWGKLPTGLVLLAWFATAVVFACEVLPLDDQWRFQKGDETNTATAVKNYSNAKTVELFVNGQSVGKCVAVADDVFIWPKVTLAPGKNHIEAKARRDGRELHDECLWNLLASGGRK